MKMLDRLKKYFSSTPKEQLEKDWEEVKELNNIDDGGTLEYMLKEENAPTIFKHLKHKAVKKI